MISHPRPLPCLQLALALSVAMMASTGAAALTCPELEALSVDIVAARDRNPADGVARGETALAEADASESACPAGRAALLGGIATNLHILGRNPEAVQRYEEGLEALGSGGTPAQIAFLHRGLGVVLVDIEHYERALGHYLVALETSEGTGDRIESAKTAGNIGILYVSLGDFDKARDYHGRSLAGFEAAGFKPGIAGALINLGAVAAKFGEQAIADGDTETSRREHRTLQELNERALALFEELGNPRGVAYAASNIGLALERLGQPLLALPQHHRSLSLRREIGDVFGTINSLISLGTTLTTLRRYDQAEAVLEEARSLTPAESLNLRKEVAEQRVLLEEARGNFRNALAAQREVTRVVGLIAGEDQRAQVAALQDRFDADQATREIDLLRSEAHISDLRLQRQRLLGQLSVLIAMLAIGLFLVLLSRYRVGVVSARKLAAAARTDPLTGLPNRRHITELMEYEVARVSRGGRSFCLLMADLDDFKAINDRYGHDAGDNVLREVARRLRAALRKQDTVARWGGEEFLLLAPESGEAGALVLANKLRERVSSEPIAVREGRGAVTITLTLGFSEYRRGQELDDCIRAADAALFQGKREGKDRAAGPQAEARREG